MAQVAITACPPVNPTQLHIVQSHIV
jgi:hypothetical protein